MGTNQGVQAGTSGTQGRVYIVTPQTEAGNQSMIQGTFLLFRQWARVLFDSGASHSFRRATACEFSPRTKARIDQICRGCELEISEILLTVDLRVMDMLVFEVILGMDWLTAHRVVIDCDRMRVTAYTIDGTCVVF